MVRIAMQDFEKSFSEFIDRREYDEAENALFSIVREAFKAGWHASCGELIESQKILELVPGSLKASRKI